MAYQKHNFATGGTIQAAPFNEMDDQIAANEAAVAGKYEKPSGGIPESDLAAAFAAKVTAAQEAAAAAQTAAAGKQDVLPQAYLAYLEEMTYQKPAITSLYVASMGGEVEIGTEITVAGITHDEENLQNIAGDLVLKHGDTVLASQIPISTAPYTLDTPYRFTRRTAGTETVTLSGTDTHGNSFSKGASQRFYVPKFTGASTSAAVTAADILSMQRAKALQSSVTVSGVAAYIYFATDGSITSVKSGGFDVPFITAEDVVVSINGIDVTYHVYRTENQAVPGTYSFEIS